jgi:hypothetical protein
MDLCHSRRAAQKCGLTTSLTLELLRHLEELPASKRRATGSILPGYAQLKAGGYAKVIPIDDDVLTEITDKGRRALAEVKQSASAIPLDDLNASNDE